MKNSSNKFLDIKEYLLPPHNIYGPEKHCWHKLSNEYPKRLFPIPMPQNEIQYDLTPESVCCRCLTEFTWNVPFITRPCGTQIHIQKAKLKRYLKRRKRMT